jgi:hypothetical protein
MTATRLQIVCVKRSSLPAPHERITHIGGVNLDRSPWQLDHDEAVEGVQNGTWTFFINDRGVVDNVVVGENEGHFYLKAAADTVQPENLLKIPTCPDYD